MEIRAPYLGRGPEPVDALDRDTFYGQYNELLNQALAAGTAKNKIAAASFVAQLGILRDTNPQLTVELQTRWQAIDSEETGTSILEDLAARQVAVELSTRLHDSLQDTRNPLPDGV